MRALRGCPNIALVEPTMWGHPKDGDRMQLLGKPLADTLCASMAPSIKNVHDHLGRPPGLGVLLVGEDPASAVYVRHKERRAIATGLKSWVIRLPADASQRQVDDAVHALNANAAVDAFIVQLPLPAHLDATRVVSLIHPDKDADGLHPLNMGRLVAGIAGPRPCTPAGVMALLSHANVQIEGAHATVVGRSTIVGKPMALLLLQAHATVTICHSRSRTVQEEVARADIVVAAVGKPEMIRGAWIKPGATVIDVGINRAGTRLVGDVEFAAAAVRAKAITPVPGGVGPMTIAMLLHNTVQAALRLAPSVIRPGG